MERENNKKAVVLLGHGSKREEANNVLKDLSKMLEEDEENISVYYSFLQFTTPTLDNAIDKVASNSIDEVTIIPVFLYPGVHLKEDIPEKINELKGKYPEISFKISDPIGADRRLIPILMDRVKNSQEKEV